MNITIKFVFALFFISYFFVHASERAVLVHNTIQDIENCKDKLQLKLIRVWGGDEEEDENKLLVTPVAVAFDKNMLIYICDLHNHCIKVFSYFGKYIRTIGRKGRGPGDLYAPSIITFSPKGELMVLEYGGRRIQWFSSEGKSKKILKCKGMPGWIGVTSQNEIAVYDSYETFIQRKLISIINNKGKVLKKIGRYHDKSKNYITSEKIHFAMDENDNLYAANKGTPVIRKYSPQGRLLRVITFETPLEIPVEIILNKKGDEIERIEEPNNEVRVRIDNKENGVSIQYSNRKGKQIWKDKVCKGIVIDSKNRIIIITIRRNLTEKESSSFAISGNLSGVDRDLVDYNIVEKIDVNRLMVFDSNGKIIAQSPMTTLCSDIYIYNNRIYVVDGMYNQRILEYEMIFKN
jgi:hypothetical protein